MRIGVQIDRNTQPIGNANGEPTAQTLATGTPSGALSTAWTYDALGQLTSLVNASPSGVRSAYGGPSGIGYDAAGNVTSVSATTLLGGTSSTSYGYNGAFELTSANSLTNSFDGAGNPTALRGTATFSYNADNELTSAQGLYQYDNNGNPTTYAGVALTFNSNNEPTAIGGALTAGYSADGLRAWKANAQGTKTYYIYDGSTPVCEMSGGLPVAENTFGPTGLVSRTGLTAGSSGLSGYSTMYYMFDAAGNVSERDDASGDIMSTGSYDAFGAGGMQAVPGTTGLSGDPFGFGGQFGYYTDGETRLVLCGQRYYDPGAARWLTRDPIGLLGGVNPYAYCGNNPVGAADPSGLYFWVDDATFALGGAVLGIAGQGLSDVISGNGRASSWQTYTGAAVGGAAGGWSLEYTGPVGAGAIGGAATNFTQQELNMHTGEQSGLDLGSVASNAALGALFGKISTWGIKGINTGRGNFNQIYQQITTKAKNSTISRITALTAGKMFVGRAWATAQLQGAVPNAIWGATGLLNPDTGDSMIGPGIFDQDAGDDCQ